MSRNSYYVRYFSSVICHFFSFLIIILHSFWLYFRYHGLNIVSHFFFFFFLNYITDYSPLFLTGITNNHCRNSFGIRHLFTRQDFTIEISRLRFHDYSGFAWLISHHCPLLQFDSLKITIPGLNNDSCTLLSPGGPKKRAEKYFRKHPI